MKKFSEFVTGLLVGFVLSIVFVALDVTPWNLSILGALFMFGAIIDPTLNWMAKKVSPSYEPGTISLSMNFAAGAHFFLTALYLWEKLPTPSTSILYTWAIALCLGIAVTSILANKQIKDEYEEFKRE